MALRDGSARRAGLTVAEHLGLEFVEGRHVTSFSIGLDSPEVVRRKVLDAADFPVLKLKLGGPDDAKVLEALREVAPEIVETAQRGKVAILFGPEDHGLSNKDIEHCQTLVTIPTNPKYQSLNVAQAAVICLYEIYIAGLPPPANEPIERARADEIERLFAIMREALLKIGFLDSENPEHMLLALRRILGRAGLEGRDVRILTGMFRQIEWYANQGWKIVEEKQKRGIKVR